MTNESYDDWEDDHDEYDDLEDSDADETETIACSNCKEEIYEDADQCPYCGHYVTASTTSNRKPLWIVITAVVTIYAILHFYISAIFFG